ncbi:MAG: hemerythrin family protein [Spirochaetes bacterium]|nr:hemerythrin family protein [Spirochaetota bacterium]
MDNLSNKWKVEYETGIPEIDSQHKQLFTHIETLSLAIYSNSAKKELVTLINFLRNYISWHFSTEESLMMQAHYPDIHKHTEIHRSFEKFFQKIESELSQKGADKYLAIEVENKMHDWWVNHILQIDMKYVPFMKDHNK